MKTIFLLGHGWHTGLAFPLADVPASYWPERALYPDAEWLEVGWGDEGFYRAEKVTFPLACKALFWPTPSVLHLVGIEGPIAEYFTRSSIVELEISDDGFDRACRFVDDSFRTDDVNRPHMIAEGIYGNGKFFRSNQSYFFPRTCNAWTAKALRIAGLPMWTWTAQTAANVMRQGRRLGQELRRTSSWDLKRAALAGEQPGPVLSMESTGETAGVTTSD